MNKTIRNIIYIFLPITLGAIVGLITKGGINYQNLVKPPLSPPGLLFPIMWSILYLLMGISYYLLHKKSVVDSDTKISYYLQLFFNLLWSIIFFSLKLRLVACVWIVALDILIILMINAFSQKYKISAYLNIPYFIWCLFATYLTFAIYILN